MIKFLDLKAAYLELKADFDEAYHRVMDSGWYLLGEETNAFEEEYARFCGTKYCISVANGLDALVLTLRALEISTGDEVIVPSHTFIASWLAISQTGARPIAVDSDSETFNIDPDKIKELINSKTKAIMPVHLYGQPAEMNPIREIADHYGLSIIEDAAQSHGATYHGEVSGSLGTAAAHSFYPGKNLGAFSDGGAVTTNDQKLAETVRKLRNYGSAKKYHHELPGVNSRIDELQAAFLRIKLAHLPEWNARRSKLAAIYQDQLAGIEGLQLPKIIDQASSVWHLFVVRTSLRQQLQQHLTDANIASLIHYPIPAHLSGAYQGAETSKVSVPIAEALANSVLSLPVSPHHTEADVMLVCQTVRDFFASSPVKV